MLALPSRLALLSAALVIVAISGAALVWDGPAAPTWSADGVVAEYRSEAARLQLAPGWRWQKELSIDAGTTETPMHYGKGFGTQMADYRWFCSWATRAVSKRLAPKARRNALEQLSTKMRAPPFSMKLPESAVAGALRGEIQYLREDASMCGKTVNLPVK